MIAAAAHDYRPEFRVAVFGLEMRLRRLLEIVLRHARHNTYRYTIAPTRGPGEFDIALVDMTVSGGPEVANTLYRILERGAVIKVGRRDDATRPRDDLIQAQFTSNVLQTLNQMVETFFGDANPSRRRDVADGFGVSEDGATRRPRALVVDDSPTVRRQLTLALHQMGVDCDALASAHEALAALEQRRYEVALVDVMMPELDGFALTRQIKRDRTLRAVPVVILTSRSSTFDLARGALAGCNSYLVKPVSLRSLRATVNRQIRRSVKRYGAREGTAAPHAGAPLRP